MSFSDSVPLEALEASAETPKKDAPRLNVGNVKLLFALFVIFMVVSSDMFIDNIISSFGENAIKGRDPTPWGTTLQGIFLVIFYIVAIYLTENGII